MRPEPSEPRALRVAHIVPNLAIGGRERAVAELVGALDRHGAVSTVVTYDPLPPGTAELPCAAPMIRLDRRARGFDAQLARALADGCFDIAHAQGHIPAWYLHRAARLVPGLATMATMHVDMAGTWRWAWQVRRALRSMDVLDAVSPQLAEKFAWLAGRSVGYAPNGVSLETFAAAAPRFPGRGVTFRFAMAARLVKGKRLFDAVAAADLLVAKGMPVELHIAGDGPLAERLRIAALSRIWLRLHGPVADVPAFLANSHAFLIPSLAEGMPLAMMEAMASGLPVVASDIAPLRIVGDGAALFAPPRDVAALAGHMAGLVQGELDWHRFSRAARSRAARFALSETAVDLAARYRTMVGKTAAAPL